QAVTGVTRCDSPGTEKIVVRPPWMAGVRKTQELLFCRRKSAGKLLLRLSSEGSLIH
ncbi:MAG: hypothetical protein H6R46_176, partial [Proteobacteria bacterium]|nr:hypothetical protein [Pseudomonadota bacterium]